MASPPAKKAKTGQTDHLGRPEWGLTARLQDATTLEKALVCFRERHIVLPTYEQLRNPDTIPKDIQQALAKIDPDAKHPLNLFRMHWYNGPDRKSRVSVPQYLELPKAFTGIDTTILVAVGQRFPMIHAHKVLAAYACLVPRLITGQFDPTRHRAIWPSTGNYCRGGVAISRIMGCRSSAILPEGMSRERFEWLEEWVTEKSDIVRTTGTESNVREIYEKCDEILGQDSNNYNFNQFADFGNHCGHYAVTGPALDHVFRDFDERNGGGKSLRAFTSATGSAGAIGSGDFLKERHGSKIVAAESIQCPTLLRNGFGEHNIQGIGDKHVPFIHNVTNTDVIVGIDDVDTDSLSLVFTTDAGKAYLRRRGIDEKLIELLPLMGYSGICNTLAAIKTAKHFGYGKDDVIVTVATDSCGMYASEFEHLAAKHFNGKTTDTFDQVNAAEAWGRAILGANTGDVMEMTETEKNRVFNLGYYTWVEQRGVSVEEFECRRRQSWWNELHGFIPQWNKLIGDFNAKSKATIDP